jgi:hypothetical protein
MNQQLDREHLGEACIFSLIDNYYELLSVLAMKEQGLMCWHIWISGNSQHEAASGIVSCLASSQLESVIPVTALSAS